MAIGCSVDEAAFQARVFTCDTAARDPRCGTDRDGKPMTCFPASQLDGTDFCTQSCGDQPMTFAVDSTVCVQGGAKLAFCNPDDTSTPSGPCGRSDLGCLRTDVTADEGVCLTMQPCSQDDECPTPSGRPARRPFSTSSTRIGSTPATCCTPTTSTACSGTA